LKRALKKRVKAELENTPSDGAPVEPTDAVHPRINQCRVPTTAAMIGLAISMGATSLLVTRQSDQAAAAEALGNQNTTSTIPTSDAQVKFTSTKKLQSQAVSSVSTPENPAVVEPTAISHLTGPTTRAKRQVEASRMSVQASAPVVVPSSPQVAQERNIAWEKNNVQQSRKLGAQALSNADGIAGVRRVSSISARLETAQKNTPEPEVNAQLKAQQEFALNRLQEKSNRLRKSLAQWRSEETKDLSQQAATRFLQPMTMAETIPQTSTSLSATEQSDATSDISKASLVSRLKQRSQVQASSVPDSAAVVAPSAVAQTATATTYEVKPGDTSVTVPTPVLGNTKFRSYIESTTVNLAENTIKSSQTSGVVASYGVGGDAPVPKVFTEIQLAQRPTAATAKQVQKNQRLRSLQLEIEKLREKYRSQQTGHTFVPERFEANEIPAAVPVSNQNDGAIPISVPQPNDAAVQIPVTEQNNAAIVIPVPRPIAPNYDGKPGKRVYRANRIPTNEPINPELLPNQAIGTPPMGVDASRSLGSMRGSTVSPQLPPLAAVDRYLPRPIDENTPPPSTSTTAYNWPAKGTLTSGFGMRWGRMHKGIDIANSTGTPIYASADGIVEKAGWNSGGYGNLVDIRHTDGSMTRYGHNSKLLVQAGQQVHKGQIIAAMGSTGYSTGPHSHFEIHPTGRGAVNPIAFLPVARL
jgi:murein DD-endopeptidase MepM/ murein hydrolase activator NlpD